jgi:hypothetical protein|tara:strand:+ start:125 stop:340 length:216 start_codon:yes stop_codon:yes gene_type:complete
MDKDTRELIEEARFNLEIARKDNEVLNKKISIAIQGLEVIISMGDSMIESVAQQTLQEMQNCDQNSSQEEE